MILICRGHVKVKHCALSLAPCRLSALTDPPLLFPTVDFDLAWVSKYSNLLKATFWQETCPFARHEMITEARNGGSMNPQYLAILKQHIKSGAVDLKTTTELKEAMFNPETRMWRLVLETRREGKASAFETVEDVDYLVCSTGSKLEFSRMLPLVSAPRSPLTLSTSQGCPAYGRFSNPILSNSSTAFPFSRAICSGPRLFQPLSLARIRCLRFVPLPCLGAHWLTLDFGDGSSAPMPSTSAELDSEEEDNLQQVDEETGLTRQERAEARSGGERNFFEGLEEVEA